MFLNLMFYWAPFLCLEHFLTAYFLKQDQDHEGIMKAGLS